MMNIKVRFPHCHKGSSGETRAQIGGADLGERCGWVESGSESCERVSELIAKSTISGRDEEGGADCLKE